jgi:osmotically-inducible protein OsmY
MLRIVLAVLLLSVAACKDGPPAPAQAATPKAASKPQPAAVEQPATDPNHELAMRVRRALEDAGKIDAPAIDVTAADGLVTLWGSTRSLEERRLAGEVTARVEGVKSVRNELVIVRGS